MKIIVDHRERENPVLDHLDEIELEYKQLPVGDFILSEDACVEFKRDEDFINSLIDIIV